MKPAPEPVPTVGTSEPVPESWYESAFGGEYLQVYRRRNDERAVGEARLARTRLGLEPGDRVLDLCCGAGRHVKTLRGDGLDVVGLDRSPDLLARAARETDARLVRGDMRHLPFASPFRAVLSFFTSFGYFFRDEENQRVLEEMARVLEPGGGLFLDLPDRQTTVETLVPRSERVEGALTVKERRWITEDGCRVEKEVVVEEIEAGKSRRYHESVRLFEVDEAVAHLGRAGFEVTAVLGDFTGVPHESGGTPRMILLGRKGTP